MNISLAITTYMRFDLTIKSCAQVLDDPRINDIILLDDKSTDGSFEKLVKHFEPYPHVRVIQQAVNRGMQQNKADAISFAKNEWVIILDSDNIIMPSYIDAFFKYEHNPDIIYCPEYARPNFNFTELAGQLITRKNVAELLRGVNGDQLNISINACNYAVHRDTYRLIYRHNPKMKATDTVWFSFLWLSCGKAFFIVPGMQYDHLVHAKSGFLEDPKYNMEQAEKIKKMIMSLWRFN